ncbi:hypothetical protein [Chondrinema litorale]|uniref:hypothetical protein n=1 Tax=Chondrinema litorale TaxID=2994555 RepID=UPI00254328A9|nr:hypothetical protein [Chondrinema litorale]UZR95253.1 hypothetical protein OQ292_05400 [Chondrinema litorale]
MKHLKENILLILTSGILFIGLLFLFNKYVFDKELTTIDMAFQAAFYAIMFPIVLYFFTDKKENA